MKFIELGSNNHYDYVDGKVVIFEVSLQSCIQVNWYDEFYKQYEYKQGDTITAGWNKNRSTIGRVISVTRFTDKWDFDDEGMFRVKIQQLSEN